MPKMNRLASTGAVVLALCAAFCGCSSRTNVSVTGSTPSQFTHVFITTQEVWFNTNASAGPDDSGWAKFPLKTAVTVDLVTEANGTLGEVANDLRLAPGTYNSILLLPVSPTTALTTSAQALGASFNQEADYVDSSGTAHQVPLVLPNPEKGIVASGTSLKVPVGKVSATGVGIGSSTPSTTNNSSNLFAPTSNLFGTPATSSTVTPSSSSSSTSSSSSSSSTTTVSFAASFDGNRDLHLFSYSGGKQVGALMSTHPSAADLATAGAISGTLTLTSLTNINNVSNRVAIQASAESLSADGTHHVIVATAPVQSDGTFTLYPLPSNSKTPTTYDVVIHGPGIATLIIKNVSVTTTPPSLAGAASTTGSVASTTATTPVSLGTFIPRAATSFLVQVTPTSSAALPPGAAVTFYQTLPASGEVPYVIDEVGVDPFIFNLVSPEPLSMGTIDSGTYSSSGSTITVTSSTPAEGAGTYGVGATAPLYADSVSSTKAALSSGTSNTTPVNVSVPGLTPAGGSAVGSITATVTSPGHFDQGELIVSHNGAVVGTASLNAALTSGAQATVGALPSGTTPYYLSVIVWNSSNPGPAATGGSFTYESIASPVTVSAGGATGVQVAIQ
jgi:Domain of unknown function (DUF4382)